MKRILTGIKPSGDLHLGNYFGVIEPLLELQERTEDELFVFIANYHAQTSVHDKEALERNSYNILKIYIAAGLDPQKSTIYLQSDVPEVQELAWIFSTLTTMPELMRAHAFKDAEAKNKDINVGTFYYPLLMAADITLMKADLVPVGKDQIQHVEMAREMVRDFNVTYGDFLIEPKEMIKKEIATVPGTDGQKMSKSYKNVVPIIASDEEWKKAIFSIKTGTSPLGEPIDPNTCNIFALHKLLSKEQVPELEKRYKEGSIGFKESKEILIENLKKKFSPLRDKFNSISNKEILEMIEGGRERAKSIAKENIEKIRELSGIIS